MLNKKTIFIAISVLVVVGLASGVVFAKEVISNERKVDIKAERIVEDNDNFNDMVQLMNEYGYQDMAKYMNENNYEAMNDLMRDVSEEEYEDMIKIMEENGYGFMGPMMGSFGREEMIEMHETMGQYHRENGNAGRSMMGR